MRSILALGDESRGGAQHITPGAEYRKRGIGARQQVAHALPGPLDPELGDEGGLAQCRVLSGLLAERRRIALDVEQVVGDLERFTERAAIIVERLILFLRGLAEDRAGNAAIVQQLAGLHLLQPRDVDRLAVTEPALAGKVEHLATRHAADP